MQEKLYEIKGIPVFQNKVCTTIEEANTVVRGNVLIEQEPNSGLIYNAAFEPDLMIYDQGYQNEQGHSPFFQAHLKEVLSIIHSLLESEDKVVEIGCGKGFFLEMMRETGIDVTGFDPTYEGDKPYIIKEYFDESSFVTADLIVLRHTMEHIPQPFDFLKRIAKANHGRGKIFIEVPTFDWIVEHKAFWDIFYEHCNYFTEASFSSFFSKSETGKLFGEQYMYIVAELSDLLEIPDSKENQLFSFDEIQKEKQKWETFLSEHKRIAIWGAGAKGNTFLNLLDPHCEKVSFVIDMNPAKQGKYIAGTGHAIVSPEVLKSAEVKEILVMNENYLEEIREMVSDFHIQLFNL